MVPYEQVPSSSIYYQILIKTVVFFEVKTSGNIAVAPAMRSVFRQTAPDYAVDNFVTMQPTVDPSNFNQRLGLYLTCGICRHGCADGGGRTLWRAGATGELSPPRNRRSSGIRLHAASKSSAFSCGRAPRWLVAGLGLGMVCALLGR